MYFAIQLLYVHLYLLSVIPIETLRLFYFNIFYNVSVCLGHIFSPAVPTPLHHEGSVSIGGRLITNFRFADDIVVNAEEEEEAGVLIDRLDRTTIGTKWRSVQTRQK